MTLFASERNVRPIRLGIIGAGGIARSSHLPAIALLHKQGWSVTVYAIADPDAKNVANAVCTLKAGGCLDSDHREYDDGAALLADGCVDCALILTPASVTHGLIRIALQCGVPALAEKPGAHNLETLSSLIRAERAHTEPIVRIAYNRRSQPLAAAFRFRLGEILETPGAAPVHLEARLWRSARTDSIFYDDTMVHLLDFVLWSLGSLSLDRVDWRPANEVRGLAVGLRAFLRSASEREHSTTAAIDVRPAVGRDLECYEVLASRRALDLNYSVGDIATNPAALRYYTAGKVTQVVPPDANRNQPAIVAQGFVLQLANFMRLVLSADSNTESALCTLNEAHAALTLRNEILATMPVPV